MKNSSATPISPIRRKTTHPTISLPGFRPAPKPNNRPISQMTVRELQDRFNLNSRILASPCVLIGALLIPTVSDYCRLLFSLSSNSDATASSYAQRVTAEQAAVESRLIELRGMETINTSLRKATLREDSDMAIDVPTEPPTSRTLEAKRKALAQFVWHDDDHWSS